MQKILLFIFKHNLEEYYNINMNDINDRNIINNINNNIKSNIYIGIDPSLNSTGMTLFYNEYNTKSDINKIKDIKFYNIKHKSTKKELKLLDEYYNKQKLNQLGYSSPQFEVRYYDHIESNVFNKNDDNKDSHMFELAKTYNLMNIVKQIREAIILYINRIYHTVNEINIKISGYEYIDCYICIEANSFNSRSSSVSLIELCGLNYLIRNMILELKLYNIKFNLLVTPPTEIKKFATGRGDADKELMLYCFKLMNKEISDELDFIKLDDIADSYFMAQYPFYLYNISKKEKASKNNKKDIKFIYKENIKNRIDEIIDNKKQERKQNRINKKQKENKEHIWDDSMMEFADKI